MKYIVIYTDGSCYWKVKLGGYGVYMEYKTKDGVIAEKRIKGNNEFGYSETTIDRMELRAIVVALESIKPEFRHLRIRLVADRKACIESINQGWVFNWEKDNFFERKNADLWKRFLKIYRQFDPQKIIFTHTRGHGKGKKVFERGNDIADELADYKSFDKHIEDGEGVL